MRQKKILILNRGGSDNLGDQAIRKSLEMLFESRDVEVTFEDFTNVIEEHSYYSNQVKKTRELKKLISYLIPDKIKWYIKNKSIFNVLKKNIYDAVLIGGGQLINKNEIFAYSMYLWTKKVKKMNINTKLFLYSVGAMNEFSKSDYKYYKKSFNKFDDIFVRDEYAQVVLKEQFNVDAKLTFDVAFSYRKYKESTKNTTPKKDNTLLIGFTDYGRYKKYNTGLTKDEFYGEYIDKIKNYENQNYKITFFYTTKSDLVVAKEINELVFEKYNNIYEIANIQNLDDLINYFKVTKKVVSPRMHALILSSIYDCEVEPELLSDKIITFKNKYLSSKLDLNGIVNKIEEDIDYLVSIIKGDSD